MCLVKLDFQLHLNSVFCKSLKENVYQLVQLIKHWPVRTLEQNIATEALFRKERHQIFDCIFVWSKICDSNF
jgi:hypothetical protein